MSGLHRWLTIAALLLCGCGGNPGPDPVSEEPPPVVPLPPPINTTVVQGLYLAQLDPSSGEFSSLVLPIDSSSAHWYGWFYKGLNATSDPYLFSGILQLGEDGAAQTAADGLKAFTSGVPGSGSVALSQASAAGFNASVSAIAQQNSLAFSALAAPTEQYQYGIAPSLAALARRWDGVWSSAGSHYSTSLSFDSSGALSAGLSNWPCALAGLRLAPSAQGGNAFDASLVLPARTNCSWTPNADSTTLRGIALVQRVGNQDQLDLMLLDSTGRGVSFRGKPG